MIIVKAHKRRGRIVKSHSRENVKFKAHNVVGAMYKKRSPNNMGARKFLVDNPDIFDKLGVDNASMPYRAALTKNKTNKKK